MHKLENKDEFKKKKRTQQRPDKLSDHNQDNNADLQRAINKSRPGIGVADETQAGS